MGFWKLILPSRVAVQPLWGTDVAEDDGTCTQMHYAQQGVITEEMAFIAAFGALEQEGIALTETSWGRSISSHQQIAKLVYQIGSLLI